MKNKGKHKRILILMIASQVLLTGFVIQWLFSQYLGEKEALVKELTGFYLDSQDEMLDTLLFKSYVNPVLSENRIIIMDHKSSGKDSNLVSTTLINKSPVKHRILKMNGKNETITLNIRQNTDSSGAARDTSDGHGLPEDMLLRSVRLIVARSEDSAKLKNHLVKSFILDFDTSKFKKLFDKKLSGTGMKFLIGWEENKTHQDNDKGKRMIYIKAGPGISLPQAAVERYHGYLAGRILPQIIFGALLVIITAFAFLLSYRSISNQIILNSLRDEFVSNITHELKTPVATLKVALESLGKYKMRNEPVVMEEYLKLASIETKRLEDLINRVLDHSLLDEQNHPLELVRTDINQLIREVVDPMQQRLGKSGRIEFHSRVESILVRVDPLYLKGVLINLVDNSIKYCNKEPLITIESGRKDGFAVIEVRDNGPGIPEEYQKKVFEKFFRLPSDDIHNVKGYGLGLSFASLVMKHHNGSIEVRNLEHGCSFILKIPVV